MGHSFGGVLAQLLALRFYFDPAMNFIKTGGYKNAKNQVCLALATYEK
jgi:putative lipase involved disintegration of autophagic bodies